MNRIALLALALFAMFALAVNAIIVSDDWWVIALTLLASMVVFAVIGHDVRRLMDSDEEDDEPEDRAPSAAPRPAAAGAPAQPGAAFTGADGDDRAVIVTVRPMTA